MVTRTDKCNIELYIINDEKYTDYEIDKMFNTRREDYDLDDDVNEVVGEIVEELYKTFNGQYKFLLEIKFIYEKDYDYYSGCYEYDMDYEFKIIEQQQTNYFDDIGEE